MITHRLKRYVNKEWFDVGHIETDSTGRSIAVFTTTVQGKVLLHPVTPIKAVATTHKYDEPPWPTSDEFPFDDELKF